jgi:PBSX family phage terminase large subunit
VTPQQWVYEPKGAATALFYDRSDEILIEGPAGTGKTRAVLEKIHYLLARFPGSRGLIARKTRTSMTESVLVTYEEKVLEPGSPIKSGPGRAHRMAYNYPNGSTLVIGGMDNVDRVMSTEYDVVGVFEATELTEDDLEKLTTRLRNGVMPYQQLIADCNPSGEYHWLNQRAKDGRMSRLLSRHEDNPTVTETYLDKLRALTGARRARLYEGRWASQEGMVYDTFDQAIHVLDTMPDGWQGWRKFRAVDFGYTNPFVCQWWAIDPDGRMYLYRELYRSRVIVEDHAARITELSGKEKYEATIADHDAEDRATMERHGIVTQPAYKAVLEGIQAVQERLRVQPDGRPRLYLIRDAVVERDPDLLEAKKPCSSVDEIEGYVWQKSREGKPEKEEPVKEGDHGMDAMRYAVAYAEKFGRRSTAGWYPGMEVA